MSIHRNWIWVVHKCNIPSLISPNLGLLRNHDSWSIDIFSLPVDCRHARSPLTALPWLSGMGEAFCTFHWIGSMIKCEVSWFTCHPTMFSSWILFYPNYRVGHSGWVCPPSVPQCTQGGYLIELSTHLREVSQSRKWFLHVTVPGIESVKDFWLVQFLAL